MKGQFLAQECSGGSMVVLGFEFATFQSRGQGLNPRAIPCPSGCAWEWDNLTCWEATSVGDIVVVSCPELFEFMSPEERE